MPNIMEKSKVCLNFMKNKNIVDLSMLLEDGMITYPTSSHHKFESSIVGRIEVEGRETRKFTMGSHCGTHVDAMRHFEKEGLTIDQLPIDIMIGKAQVINLGKLEPGSIIDVNQIKNSIKKGVERIILRTDWSRFWNSKQFYQDWPYLTKEATELIINHGVKLVALDFPSPDSAYYGEECSLDCPNHKLLFSNNIILVEYLTNLESLTSDNVFLMVSPLKLGGFDGAPARVTAYDLPST